MMIRTMVSYSLPFVVMSHNVNMSWGGGDFGWEGEIPGPPPLCMKPWNKVLNVKEVWKITYIAWCQKMPSTAN